MLNRFLSAKQNLVETGELTPRRCRSTAGRVARASRALRAKGITVVKGATSTPIGERLTVLRFDEDFHLVPAE